MKIIFSRKGFDSSYGGGASPIMPNDDLVSLPIPAADNEEGVMYSDVHYQDRNYLELMQDLQVKLPDNGLCHLDPDLIREARPRLSGWHGAFGQQGAAQSHLQNEGVGVGDLFLFFGSFKRTRMDEPLRFEKDHVRHVIFGYLKIGAVLRPHQDPVDACYNSHPHLQNKERYQKQNALYVARSEADYGTFKYSDELVLTKKGYPKSIWSLPNFFTPNGEKKFSRHADKKFDLHDDHVMLQTVGIGQDFVIGNNAEAAAWAMDLVERKKAK